MHVIPGGFRSYWGDELSKRRFLEARFREIFSGMGFREVETPSVELAEVFERVYPEDKLFFVEDRLEGQRLALRYDHTLPLLRSFLSGALGPVKEGSGFFYIGKVFRNVSFGGGSFREFTQAGLEIFGSPEPEGEGKIVEVLSKILDLFEELRMEVEGFVLVLGNARFFKALLSYISSVLSLPEEVVESALERRDIHLFPEEIVPLLNRVYDVSRDFGSFSRIVEPVPPLNSAFKEVSSIAEIFSSLARIKIVFDPGFFVNTNFYSGTVFSLNHASLPFPVLSGGRYDPFTEKFLDSYISSDRKPVPSIGFALGLERIASLMPPD